MNSARRAIGRAKDDGQRRAELQDFRIGATGGGTIKSSSVFLKLKISSRAFGRRVGIKAHHQKDGKRKARTTMRVAVYTV